MNYEKVIEIVKKASGYVFDTSLKSAVNMKGEADYVTAVDMEISNYIKKELENLAPDIAFMSEEGDTCVSGERWILDPIDGTTNLVYDYNVSSVSLAHYDGNNIVFGVIYNPFTKDLFVAKRNEGAYLNGKKLDIAEDRELKKCIIEFGAGSTKKQYTDESFWIGREIFRECLDIRRMCSSALAIAYVAAGKINGYFERSIKPWDYAAAYLLLEECGVLCTDWEGNKIQFEHQTSFVCGTAKAYSLMMDKIKKCPLKD